MKIMFVCTGNTCRSPMAEYLFRKLVNDSENRDIEIFSSGLFATTGHEANEHAINVGKLYNIDLTKHKATNICDVDIEPIDLVLCAENIHKIELKERYPTLRIYTIKEFAGENEDIDLEDPYSYDSDEAYLECISEIEENLKIILEKI